MRIVKKMPIAMGWSLFKEAITNGQLSAGDELELDDGSKWRVLDVMDDGVLIWQHTGSDKPVCFNENGSNVYEGSDIQRYLQGDFRMSVPAELLEMVDGDFFLLSIEEIEKYIPTEAERVATDKNGDTVAWWTRSAYRGIAAIAWYVYAAGYANTNTACHAHRARPACKILKSK